MTVFCKSCGAQIWFGTTKNGKLCPYNDELTTISHFTSCDNPQRFSKSKSKSKSKKGSKPQ